MEHDVTLSCQDRSSGPILRLESLKQRLADFEPRRVDGMRRAAVAAVFRPGEEGTEVLLIHRAEHPQDPWSGHVSFPGGRVDPEDRSPQAAAVRETCEEVGLDLEHSARAIGRFSDLTAVAQGRRLGLVIEPFAYELVEEAPLTINREVQEAFWLPLSFLSDSEQRSFLEYPFEGGAVKLPCYRYQGRVLWGLTLRMLDEVIELLTGKAPTDWPFGR